MKFRLSAERFFFSLVWSLFLSLSLSRKPRKMKARQEKEKKDAKNQNEFKSKKKYIRKNLCKKKSRYWFEMNLSLY